MTTIVVNLRAKPYDVYIGRAGKGFDGYFGNPYRVEIHGDKAISLFKKYFISRLNSDLDFRRRVLELRGKRLGCFCKPRPCHGDIIAEWINSQTSTYKRRNK